MNHGHVSTFVVFLAPTFDLPIAIAFLFLLLQ